MFDLDGLRDLSNFPLFGNAFVGAGAEAAPDSPDTEVPGVALADITGRRATVGPDVERSQNVHRCRFSPFPSQRRRGPPAERAGTRAQRRFPCAKPRASGY
jgi:hypothetical protein